MVRFQTSSSPPTSIFGSKDSRFDARSPSQWQYRESTLTVPKEILPHLSRLATRDYMDYAQTNQDDHGSLRRLALRFLDLPGFNYFMGFVIVSNVVVMVVETDQAANMDTNTQADAHWTAVFGWVVLCIFVVELFARIVALRKVFFSDGWNVFDFSVVVLDLTFSIVDLIAGKDFPMSILRIFRLAKLARISKVLRVFPELRLLLVGLMSSMTVIFWGIFLMLFVLLVWSMAAVLFIHPLNKTIEYDVERCERCPRAFSSVLQSALTFWQQIVAGDSWGTVTIPVVEKYPPAALFFIAVFVTLGMGVLNLILGVVVSVAEQAKTDLQAEDNAQAALLKLQQKTRLLELCQDMDSDNSGNIDKEELYRFFLQEGDFRDTILSLDIDQEDFDIIWAVIDPDSKGSVSYKELVHQVASLRSSDQQFMLTYMKYYITSVRNKLLQQIRDFHHETMIVELETLRTMKTLGSKVPSRPSNASCWDSSVQRMSTISDLAPMDSAATIEKLMHEHECVWSECNTTGSTFPVQVDSLRSHATSHSTMEHDSGRHHVTSANEHDPTEKWMQKVCNEFSTLQLQLRGILMDMNSKIRAELRKDSVTTTDIKSYASSGTCQISQDRVFI